MGKSTFLIFFNPQFDLVHGWMSSVPHGDVTVSCNRRTDAPTGADGLADAADAPGANASGADADAATWIEMADFHGFWWAKAMMFSWG